MRSNMILRPPTCCSAFRMPSSPPTGRLRRLDLVPGRDRLVDRRGPASCRAFRDRQQPCRRDPALPLSSTMTGELSTRRRPWRGPELRMLRDVCRRDQSGHRPVRQLPLLARRPMPAWRTGSTRTPTSIGPILAFGRSPTARAATRPVKSRRPRWSPVSCRRSTPACLPARCCVEVRARLEAAHARLLAEAARHGAGRDGGDDRGRAAGARRPFRLPVGRRFSAPTCCVAIPSPRSPATTAWCRRWSRRHISEAEAARHPQANIITRAVGADSDRSKLDKRTGQLAARRSAAAVQRGPEQDPA